MTLSDVNNVASTKSGLHQTGSEWSLFADFM